MKDVQLVQPCHALDCPFDDREYERLPAVEVNLCFFFVCASLKCDFEFNLRFLSLKCDFEFNLSF